LKIKIIWGVSFFHGKKGKMEWGKKQGKKQGKIMLDGRGNYPQATTALILDK